MLQFKDIVKDNYKAYSDSFRTGLNPVTKERIKFDDVMSPSQASVWLPRVISEVAREAAGPNLILAKLLDKVAYRPGLQVISGGTGSLVAADIAPGQAYPEQQIQIGGASTVATVGKSGVQFKITEEMRDHSDFDIMNLNIRAGGRALAHHKEKKAADYISSLGVCVFDNAEPTSSLFGVTTGRDMAGNPNGSLTWDDMFDLFGVVINNGFMPNIIIVHPLVWVMFMKDPVLRSFALASGGGTWWGSYSGQPNGHAPWDQPKEQGTVGQQIIPPNVAGQSPSTIQDFPQAGELTSGPQLPSYFLPFAVRIIVTPFVYYDPGEKLTDIIVADSNEIGALVVEEELFMDHWNDKMFEIDYVKLREKYSIYIYNEGLGIAVARNVSVEPNYIVLPATSTIDASSLPPIDPTKPVC